MKLAISSWSFHTDEGHLCELELHPEFEEENKEALCQELFGVSYKEVLSWKRTAIELYDQLEDEVMEVIDLLDSAEERLREKEVELEEERKRLAILNAPIKSL